MWSIHKMWRKRSNIVRMNSNLSDHQLIIVAIHVRMSYKNTMVTTSQKPIMDTQKTKRR